MVAISTGYGLEGLGSNPDGHTKFSVLRVFFQTGPGAPSLLYNEYGGLFRGVKGLGFGVEHPRPHNDEVRTEQI